MDFEKIKIDKKVLEEINKIEDPRMKALFLSDEEFEKLKDPTYGLDEEKENKNEELKTAYRNIIDILKKYIDLKEEYYNIVALWIIGTYYHKQFPSYPFLFFNAMKGSGKSRTMNLITHLSKDGTVLNSMTEAVLFRTTGTLAIDEFEGVTRKGNENLRELLNSCYKRGTKVKRMKQKKTMEGTEQVVEEFDVYRPILLANIWGMENVLGDRCISLILDKSHRTEVTNLLEIWNEEKIVIETKEILKLCSLCICSFSGKVYREWNTFVSNNYINYIYNTNNTNNTNYIQDFKTIKSMELNGRELELSFPLCLLALEISDDLLKETTLTLKRIFLEKKEEELVENQDVNLIDFISQKLQDNNYVPIKILINDFKNSYALTEEWINVKWLGRALKRLNLIIQKRRTYRGVEVILNVNKAQENIKMFK
ncbi:MAG: hypothetical protein EHM20_01645 [Alphaproteobacteria bacterium]|nr:MAG: hypothetical protein EHM20_01645 [Alphaproteobacteria bacterium]